MTKTKDIVVTVFCFLVLSVNLYGIDPSKKYDLTPDKANALYDSARIKTPDGFDLLTWFYYPVKEKDNNNVLVLAYPDKGNMSWWVYFATTFVAKGYTVVTFEYRDFGRSSNFEINRDYLYHPEFKTDLIAVVKEADIKFPKKNIGIWALSMGTIITTMAIADLENRVDFIVGDGFVVDPSLLAQRILDTKHETVILPEPHEQYARSLMGLRVPILIFAASKDQTTTSEDALNLQKRMNTRCHVAIYEGDHLRGFQAGDG